MLLLFGGIVQPKQQPEGTLCAVYFLDVGQGDSTLIITDTAAVLIDTGDSSAAPEVLSQLYQCGVTRLDWCICTHPHADHMGALPQLLDYDRSNGSFSVEQILMPEIPAEMTPQEPFFQETMDKAGAQQIPVAFAEPMTIDLGTASLEIVLSPVTSEADWNDRSLCGYLRCGNVSYCLMGDAGEKEEAALLEENLLHHADVLKVGHHGSGSASTEEFLQAVSPVCAVLSSGSDNPYGHPAGTALNRLQAYCGDQLYRTDENGTICIATDGTELFVTTE